MGSHNHITIKKNFTDNKVKRLNSNIVQLAGRHIYCHFKEQSIYNLVKKYKNYHPKVDELEVEELLKKNHD